MKQNYHSGVDEAGRGCVLGPLVLAICTLSEEQIIFFKELGVTDSKLLSKKKRESFFEIIKQKCTDYGIIVVPAEELNVLMGKYTLNEIEIQKTVELIKNLKVIPSLVVLDCPDVNPNSYKEKILHNFGNQKQLFPFEIISEHKADLNHMCVSCASVLAKVVRDRMMSQLTGTDISGYSSDHKTIEFIKKYILEHKEIPPYARSKWETITNIMNDLHQKKIGWFNDRKQS